MHFRASAGRAPRIGDPPGYPFGMPLTLLKNPGLSTDRRVPGKRFRD